MQQFADAKKSHSHRTVATNWQEALWLTTRVERQKAPTVLVRSLADNLLGSIGRDRGQLQLRD
jgi:hypothetical protein